MFALEDLDIKDMRTRYNMPQEMFAGLLGVSKGTVEGWEQGKRKPKGPAAQAPSSSCQTPRGHA